jgi:gliding motility-associated-like protein
MRKILYLLGLLALSFTNSSAQTYYQITNCPGFSGFTTQTFPDGIVCAISRNGGGFGCNAKCVGLPPTGGFCGVGPYYIGDCGRTGYRYEFSKGITDIRIKMTGLNDNDTIRISIPCGFGFCQPTIIPITAAKASTFSGTCSPTTTSVTFLNDGRFCGLNRPTGYNDVEINIQNPFFPYVIDSIQIDHRSQYFGNPSSRPIDGVVYSIEYKFDTCNLPFNVTVDSPVCSDRPIRLHATNFPNTTHSWYNVANIPWTGSGANPVIPVSSVLHSGIYIDTARRGICTFIDTVSLTVDLSPTKPIVTSPGPKCIGETDSMQASSSLGAGGQYIWYANYLGGGLGGVHFWVQPAAGTQTHDTIQNINPLRLGWYYVYAVSTNGCISDTAAFLLQMQPEAIANFTFDAIPGCFADTVNFHNFSFGSNVFNWSFGDGTGSTLSDPSHYYPRKDGSYTVRLTVGNGKCQDTMEQTVSFDHPIDAIYTVTADSVCQGAQIKFTNASVVAPATVPFYTWSFGDGSPTKDSLDVHWIYDRTGVYTTKLVVEDYLKCKDSLEIIITVDSAGSISFNVTDSTVCSGAVIGFQGTYSTQGLRDATWDFKDGNKIVNSKKIVHTWDKAGTYNVTFAADYRICPDTTYTRAIVVKPFPTIDLGRDTMICPNGKPISLKSIVNIDTAKKYTWRWHVPTKDSTPSIMVYHPGVYGATVTVDGCSTTDSVTVAKNCYIDVPNVFSPNGDGSNDYFLPRQLLSDGITKFDMQVYNRWGQKLFETKSINGRGWDGKFNEKDQPSGVYIYLISAEFENGDNEKYTGNVTLLR